LDDNQGKDVTVNFKMYDGFDANQTFWTDSNGMAMQQRVVNYQPSYNAGARSNNNRSMNFYPVTSAIVMKDLNMGRQVIVMNDRTQAGAVGVDSNSTIELIHHRRLLQDDWRCLEEPLNERDATQYGIKVNAKYYMQILRPG
jgi:hypothetical protein